MIPNLLDISDQFRRRAGSRGTDDRACLLCQRPLAPGFQLSVHAVAGTITRLIPADQPYDDEMADMGWWSVGPECAKRLPAAYVRVP